MPRKEPRIAQDVAAEEVEKTRTRLRELVEASGLEGETIAEEAGVSPAALVRVLTQPGQKLHYSRLLSILRIINVEPASFFADLYGLVRVRRR